MMQLLPILPSMPRPVFIAGPCSAETEEQVLTTAALLADTEYVHLFRCGLWKPRSSPNSFEGIGAAALPWLQKVQQQYHLPCCVEIGKPEHLELAYEAGIRHFWVGARTSVNPFAVQELAQAAQGRDISIMIKNPIALDLHLWYGNFERFYNAGIRKLAAIYRGWSSDKIRMYRNDPSWLHLIEFKQAHKEIPIIFDPSHIAGCTSLIPALVQKALYLAVDGLMTETHYCPSQALSDKEQQLTIPAYTSMLQHTCFPQQQAQADNALAQYRMAIDDIDNELIALIGKRMDIVKQIALYKKENHLPILQIDRWQEVLNESLNKARQLNVDPQLVASILECIHQSAIETQQQIVISHPESHS